jgi:signal transduction histidine kinase
LKTPEKKPPENNSATLKDFPVNFKSLNINKITLKFSNKKIEEKFKGDYFYKSLFSFRIAFITVAILYSAFGYLDFTTSESFVKEFFIIRYFIVLPILTSIFIFSFHKYFIKVWQQLLSFSFLIGGTGIIYMLLRNPSNIYYYGGMFLIFMAGYFFIKLHFFSAVLPGLILIAIYNIGVLLFKNLFHVHFEYLVATNAFYIAANIISMLALYNIERLERIDFYQSILLIEKQNEITLINSDLENQVFERTKLLDDRNKKLIHEITNRKIVEKNLVLALDKAEESDRLKSAFLANMSHEIRTPMNGILGFSELLKNPMLTGEKQKKYIEVIEKSGARLLNIINDLVDISKVESGLMEISLSETNINEQIEFIHSFFKPEVEKKGMQFNVSNKLSSKEALIKTDQEKVYAILTNLVKNAIKYSDQGTIELGCERKDNFIEFCVKDTGIGVEKNRQKAIFDRFVQEDIADTRALQGAGLGLSISKAYVEIMKGQIWLESLKEKGSTFYFTIPISQDTV